MKLEEIRNRIQTMRKELTKKLINSTNQSPTNRNQGYHDGVSATIIIVNHHINDLMMNINAAEARYHDDIDVEVVMMWDKSYFVVRNWDSNFGSGRVTQIYRDPTSRETFEGRALIRKIINDSNPKFVTAEVSFEEEPNKIYTRTIYRLP